MPYTTIKESNLYILLASLPPLHLRENVLLCKYDFLEELPGYKEDLLRNWWEGGGRGGRFVTFELMLCCVNQLAIKIQRTPIYQSNWNHSA